MRMVWKDLYVVILGAIIVHLIQAFTMMFDPTGNGAIDISALTTFIPLDYVPGVLILSSGMASITFLDIKIHWFGIFSLVLLQQALITMSVIGVMTAVIAGKYADGTIKNGIHIFNDQSWVIAYFFIHMYSIIRRASAK